MDGAYTDPAVRQAISESISQAEADRMRGDKIREELYGVKYATPTPSITVGTQVRLTGVVGDKDGDKRIRVDFGEDAEDEWAWIPCKAKCLEVIRQPFKRGEVVWDNDADQEYVITGDEDENGKVYAVLSNRVAAVVNVSASIFERRP